MDSLVAKQKCTNMEGSLCILAFGRPGGCNAFAVEHLFVFDVFKMYV